MNRSVRFAVSAPLLALVALVAAVLVAGCGGTQAPVSFDPNAPSITAKSQAFNTSELQVPADKGFDLVFHNEDAQTHNVSIYSDAGHSQRVFGGDLVGGGTHVYHVQALAPGTYYFQCDVHPEMKGTLVVGGG